MSVVELQSRSRVIRTAQRQALEALTRAHERVQQARERDPDLCRGFAAYGGVKNELDQARALLERQTYRVALAGMMSAGKSTLANALLRRPGLLPTGIEETTLTITVVTRPPAGQSEGLTVHYLSYPDALRGIFERGHFQKLFPQEVVAQAREGADAEAMRAEIERVVREGGLSDDVRLQLGGFLEALDERRGLLGKTVYPSIEARREYLAPRTHKDVGHLLLIERAEIKVDNELFAREGLEFVDLPGADSTNERQRRIAHQFLQDTDLLVAVPNAAGFRFVDIDMLERFRAARGPIRDRVFFVLNRFDEAKVAELSSANSSLSYLKKIVDMLARDYDPGNLFFTVALWAGLEEKPAPSAEDRRELTRVKQASLELIDHFERQGVLGRIHSEWNERYSGRIVASLESLREQGGVPRLRAELVRYLKNELELARLREVQGRLTSARRGLEALLDPERSRLDGLLGSARERQRATGAFVQQLTYTTRSALEEAHQALAAREGETDGYRFQLLIRQLTAQFHKAIETVLRVDNDLIDFRQLTAGAPSPEAAMQRVIDHARTVLSQKLIELLTQKLAREVCDRYREALAELDNPGALASFGQVIGRPELGERYEELLADLERNLTLITRLRAAEETWRIEQLDFSPTPGARRFSDVEDRFRDALVAELREVYADSFRALGEVLLRHYRLVLDDFLHGFADLTAEAHHDARELGAILPVELLVARANHDERRRYALAELVGLADSAGEAVDRAAQELE